MADKDFTDFTSITTATPTVQLVGYEGVDEKRILISDLHKIIQLNTAGGASYSAGQLSYDAATKTLLADTGFTGVRVEIGQKIMVPFYNGTGSTITKGTPIAGAGTYTGGIPDAVAADADNINHVIGFLGVATHDVANGSSGLATYIGAVRDADTSSLSAAPIFLASGGGLTNTLPLYPTNRLLIGGASVISASTGVIGVTPVIIDRAPVVGSYSFTSQGVSAGTYYEAGFYDWNANDANLTQAATSTAYGGANLGKAAHIGIVPSGAGSVDTGQVGLRAVGTEDSETGTQTAAQTGIITDDITTLTANTMVETSEKFSGSVTIELYVVSGSPTTYSLDFNYGFSKYDDFQNVMFTVTGIETKWHGAAADSAADIELIHHKATGWTYAATGFVPGASSLVSKAVDQAISGNIAAGQDGAWKRVSLNTAVDGSASEGVLIRITTGTNNTFQTLDLRIDGVSEGV
jgi:hypothetical protein